MDGWLGSRHGRGTVDGVLQGEGVRDRNLEIRPMQEPVRVGGRLAGDAWGLNGHGTMITPCLSMSRDRQPASKRKESVDMAPQPCTRKRAGTRSRWPRTAGLIDQQQWRDPVTRIGVRQQQRRQRPWLRSTDDGRPGGRSLRSRSRSRAGLRLGDDPALRGRRREVALCHASRPPASTSAGARFRHLGGLRRTLGING